MHLANLLLVYALGSQLPAGSAPPAAPVPAPAPAAAAPATTAPAAAAAPAATPAPATTAAASAPTPPPAAPTSAAPPPEADQPASAAEEPLARDHTRGTLFHPYRAPLGRFRLGLGFIYDALDPSAVYGFEVRFPHISADARFGLGKGWSLTGHLDTVLVINEVTLGGAWAQYFGPWSLELGLEAGVFYGRLNQLGFEASYTAPMYVPKVAVGHSWKDISLSLSLDAMMTFTQVVSVGDVTEPVGGGVSFLGSRAMLVVENKLRKGGIWYYGIGAMFTKSYYQVWILLPDSPEVVTYARLMAGYEF